MKPFRTTFQRFYSNAEIKALVENVLLYRDVLFDPVNGTPLEWNQAWESITAAVNSVSDTGQGHTVDDVKREFTELKRRIKIAKYDDVMWETIAKLDRVVTNLQEDAKHDEAKYQILLVQLKIKNSKEEEGDPLDEPLFPEENEDEAEEELSAGNSGSLNGEEKNPENSGEPGDQSPKRRIRAEMGRITKLLLEIKKIQIKRRKIEERCLDLLEESTAAKRVKYT